MRCRHSMPRFDCHPTRATWGARCGKPARRVLRGGTGTSDLFARSVPTHHTLPHAELLQSVARRVVDGAILHLIKMWLEAPVEETDEHGNKHRSTRNRDEGRGIPQGSPITPLTQKVTSNLNGWSPAGGEVLQYLTCVLRGNMFMTDDSVDQSGQGSAVERGARPAPAPCRVARGSAAVVTRVRPVRASSIPVPGGSLPARPASRSHGGYGADHAQASAEHGASAAEVCEKQWPDDRSDRDTRVERVSRCSKKAWLSRAQEAAHFKSTFPIRLIACSSRSWLGLRYSGAPSGAARRWACK